MVRNGMRLNFAIGFFVSVVAPLTVLSAVPCHASPRDSLVGFWSLKRGVAGPCATEIRTLEYYFGRDGSHTSKTKLSTGAVFEYSGTYTASDTECTTHIDGKTIGPYRYEIVDDILTVHQPEYNCRVELVREDY